MAMTRNLADRCQRAAHVAAPHPADHSALHAGSHDTAFTPAFLAALICLAMAGCASPSTVSNAHVSAPAFRDPALSIQSAMAAIAAGTSTQAEVLAALGLATVVKFDSGYEIWVYRDTSPNTATKPAELVILFAPSGIVQKTRIKPLY